MSDQHPQQDELRQRILSIPVGKHKDSSPMYLEDVFPDIAESDFADEIVDLFVSRPCQHEPVSDDELADHLDILLAGLAARGKFVGEGAPNQDLGTPIRECCEGIMAAINTQRAHDAEVAELRGRKAIAVELRNRVRLAGNKGSGLSAIKGIDDDEDDESYSRLNRQEVERLLDNLVTELTAQLEGKQEGKGDE